MGPGTTLVLVAARLGSASRELDSFDYSMPIFVVNMIASSFECYQNAPLMLSGATRDGLIVSGAGSPLTERLRIESTQQLLFSVMSSAESFFALYVGFEDSTWSAYYQFDKVAPGAFTFGHSTRAWRNSTYDIEPCNNRMLCGGLFYANAPGGTPGEKYAAFHDYDCTRTSWYRSGMERREGISEVYLAADQGLGLTGYRALLDGNGTFVGVGGWDYRLVDLSELLASSADQYSLSKPNTSLFVIEREANGSMLLMATSGDPKSTERIDADGRRWRVPFLESPEKYARHAAEVLDRDGWPEGRLLMDDHRYVFMSNLSFGGLYFPRDVYVVTSYDVSCVAGEFEDVLAGGCSSCAAPTFSTDRAESCSLCLVGYYREDEDGECKECPDHTRCETTDVTLSTLPVEKGFMRMRVDSDEIHSCIGSTYDNKAGDTDVCPGGTDPSNVPCAPDSNRRGPRCAACERKHYERPSSSRKCRKCSLRKFFGTPSTVALEVAYSLILLLIFYWVAEVARQSAIDLKRANKYARLETKIRTKWKIMFVGLHILSTMPATLEGVPYPSFYLRLAQIFAWLDFDIVRYAPLSCMGTAFGVREGPGAPAYKQVILTTQLPTFLIAACCVYAYVFGKYRHKLRCCCCCCCRCRCRLERRRKRRRSSRDNLANNNIKAAKPQEHEGEVVVSDENDVVVVDRQDDEDYLNIVPTTTSGDQIFWSIFMSIYLLITYCLYPAVAKSIFSVFRACDRYDSPHGTGSAAYLRGEYATRCDTRVFKVFQTYCAVMIAVWVAGVPAVYAILLWRKRDRLDPLVDDGKKARMPASGLVARAMEIREADASIASLQILFGPYEPQFYLYEVYETIRRCMATAVAFVVAPGSYLQVFYAIVVSLVSIKVASYLEPFFDPSDDLLFETQVWIILFSQLVSLYLMIRPSSSKSAGTILVLLLLLAICAAILFILRDFHREYALVHMFGQDLQAAGQRMLKELKDEIPALVTSTEDVEFVDDLDFKEEEEEEEYPIGENSLYSSRLSVTDVPHAEALRITGHARARKKECSNQ